MESAINTSPRAAGIVRNIGTRDSMYYASARARSSNAPAFLTPRGVHRNLRRVSHLHVSFADLRDFRRVDAPVERVKDRGRSRGLPRPRDRVTK